VGRSRQQTVAGGPSKLTDAHRSFLSRIVEEGPIPAQIVTRNRGADIRPRRAILLTITREAVGAIRW
jgi:hypothetical protein